MRGRRGTERSGATSRAVWAPRREAGRRSNQQSARAGKGEKARTVRRAEATGRGGKGKRRERRARWSTADKRQGAGGASREMTLGRTREGVRGRGGPVKPSQFVTRCVRARGAARVAAPGGRTRKGALRAPGKLPARAAGGALGRSRSLRPRGDEEGRRAVPARGGQAREMQTKEEIERREGERNVGARGWGRRVRGREGARGREDGGPRGSGGGRRRAGGERGLVHRGRAATRNRARFGGGPRAGAAEGLPRRLDGSWERPG